MSFQKPAREELENRFMHHAPKGDQAERYAANRKAILEAALTCVGLTPMCKEQTIAINKLDEALFLFNAAIARNE